jgi:hypothetical protein
MSNPALIFGMRELYQTTVGQRAGQLPHALLWNGTAASAVDMNPTNLTGITFSEADGMSGTQQVG